MCQAQVLQQRRIAPQERRVSAARAPNPRRSEIARLQILQASINRAARDSRRPRHDADAAIAGRTRLRRAEQPPPSLVEARAQSFEAAANHCFVDHAAVLDRAIETGNPPRPFGQRT